MGRMGFGAMALVGGWSLACAVSGTGTGEMEGGECLDEREGGDDARLVIEATEDSYHEMVACGGLANELSRDLERVLVTSFLDAHGIAVPDGFRYDGEGGYVSGGPTSEMTVRYLYGRDYESHAEGERVEPNLFLLDNYLRGVSPRLDFATGDVLVSWDTKGPLVELLGRGANPPNPIRFSVGQLENPTHLDDLRIEAFVDVTDARAEATVTYTLETRTMPVEALVDGDPLVFDLVSSETLAQDGSTLVASSPGVDYNDGAGTLTGDVSFELRGGPVDVDGTYVYADSSTAATSVDCR